MKGKDGRKRIMVSCESMPPKTLHLIKKIPRGTNTWQQGY